MQQDTPSTQSFSESPCNGHCASCCENILIELTLGEVIHMQELNSIFTLNHEEFDKLQTIILDSSQSGQALPNIMPGLYVVPTGMFYAKTGEPIYNGLLVGPCGYIESDGRCGDWINRPEACHYVKFDDLQCTFFRGIKLRVVPTQEAVYNE